MAAPVVTITPDPSPNGAGWHNDSLTVSVSATDAGGAGVQSITYSASGVDPIQETIVEAANVSFNIAAEGTTTVSASAVDGDGNVGLADPLIVQIDRTAPTVVASQQADPSTGYVTVTLTLADNLSGVAEVSYRIGDGDQTTLIDPSGPVDLPSIMEVGDTTVSYYATDIAGNQSELDSIIVTIEPLALDVSLTTSDAQVEVGAVTVPLDNITVSLQSAADAGTPIASTPLSSIPLSSIKLKDAPLSSIPLSSIDVAYAPLSSIPLSSIPLSSIPLSSIPLSSIGDVLASPLSSIPLSSILLSELTTADGASLQWLVAGSDLEGVPLQATHLGDLISLPLSSIDMNASPLSSIPLSSISVDIQQLICGTGGCSGTTTLGGREHRRRLSRRRAGYERRRLRVHAALFDSPFLDPFGVHSVVFDPTVVDRHGCGRLVQFSGRCRLWAGEPVRHRPFDQRRRRPERDEPELDRHPVVVDPTLIDPTLIDCGYYPSVVNPTLFYLLGVHAFVIDSTFFDHHHSVFDL